jgi:hypothetical protein
MQTPSMSELHMVDEPGASTEPSVRPGAHGCFRGARWLFGVLLFSVAIWASLGWGLRALVSAF